MMHRRSFFKGYQLRRFVSTCDVKRSTIFSLCSGAGKSGVAVFRISGSSSIKVLTDMTRCENQTFANKQMLLKRIYHPSSKEQIDKGLVLWFPGPNSLTGEDVCELHVHGGPAIIKQIYSALSSLPDFRQSLPGEFIKRSFENGKVDLTQVEGLGDLLNAENEMQRKQALKLMEGHSKELYVKWSDELLKGMAHIEAFIDFGDEENMGEEVFEAVKKNIISLMGEMERHLKNDGLYEKIRDGLKVCIVGEPNVGKSSLLNSLCKRPVSIVTSHAGTTRDVIEVPLNVDGHQILLSDTAGLRRDVPDEVEKIGIERAYDKSEKSNIMILVVDSTSREVEQLSRAAHLDASSMESFIMNQLNKLKLCQEMISSDKRLLLVFNKIDLASKEVISALTSAYHETNGKTLVGRSHKECFATATTADGSTSNPQSVVLSQNSSQFKSGSFPFTWCTTSCCVDNGLDGLGLTLKEHVDELFSIGKTGHQHSINARHHHHLEKVFSNLKEFINIISKPPPKGLDTRLELSAERLRGALHQMGLITGRITTDQILSQIFKDFCIGK